MPLFTIVMPTYNRAEKLKATILSVLEQTFSDFELLVMDDGSTDDTEKVVKGFSDARITYEWKPNSGGPATPRNRGLDKSSAPWVSFLDADDIWYPDRLAEIADAINRHPESDVFCHNEMLHVIDTGQKTLLKYGPYESNFYRVLLTEGNRLSTSAVTVRKDFLLEHRLRFNQSKDYVIVEDFDFWLRLANKGAHFSFVTKVLGEYIIENDNISHATSIACHNHEILLKEHIYKIQQFDADKDKLWKKICLRLEFDKARELIAQGEKFDAVRMLMHSAIINPVMVIQVLAAKFKYKIARVYKR